MRFMISLWHLPFLFFGMSVCDVFIEKPVSNLSITDNDMGEFSCRANVDAITWLINGTSFNNLNNSDIDEDSETSGDGGPPRSLLTIVGRTGYSGTIIQCIAVVFLENNSVTNNSVLLVQGPLLNVADLTVTPSESAIFLTWTPPFSLNLSYFDIDILYRVEVCKLNGSEALNCSSEVVGQPDYSFTERADDLFQFTVTPLSPRRNGSYLEGNSSLPVAAVFVEGPVAIPDSAITVVVFLNAFDVTVTVTFAVMNTPPGRVAHSYMVYGETVDPGPPLQLQCDDNSGVENGGTIVLQLSECDNLLLDRIYNFTIEARNRVGNSNSSFQILSTHDVSQCQASETASPGEVHISCTFAAGADALGYFIVLYSLTTYDVVKYASTFGTNNIVNTTIEGLTDEEYVVVVFDIEQNSLPEALSAEFPQRVDIMGGPTEIPTSSHAPIPVLVVITASGGQVCVYSDLAGVVVIHSTNSTDPLKLMRLYTLVLYENGLRCTGMLPDDDYHATIFTDIATPPVYTEVISVVTTPTTETVATPTTQAGSIIGLIVGIGVGTVSALVTVVVVAFVIVCIRKCGHCDTLLIPTKRSIINSDNPSLSPSLQVYRQTEPDRSAVQETIDEKVSSTYETILEAQITTTAAKKEHEDVPNEPMYEPVVTKVVGDTPRPPGDDTAITYGEVGAVRNEHGVTYAFTTVITGTNAFPLDDDKVIYTKPELAEF